MNIENENNYKLFDETIKTIVQEGASATDDMLWKRLNDQLITIKERKRRRVILWFFSGFLLLITCLFTGVLIYQDRASYNTRKDLISQMKVSNLNIKINDSLSKNKNTYLMKSHYPAFKESTKANNIDLKSSKVNEANKTKSNSSEFNIPKRFLDNKTKNNSSEINIPNRFFDHKNERNIKLENNFITQSNDESINKLKEDTINNIKVAQNPFVADSIASKQQLDQNNIGLANKEISLMDSIHQITLPINTVVEVNKTSVLIRKWYVGASINPSFSYRSLDVNDQDFEDEADDFNQNETGSFNFNFGIFAGYSLNKTIRLNAGLNYTTYSSDFSTINSSLFFDTVQNRINVTSSVGNYYVDQNDFNNENEDNEDINEDNEESIMTNYSNKLHLKYLEIPIGIEFGLTRNKLKYIGTIGFSYCHLINEQMDLKIDGYNSVSANNTQLTVKNLFTQSIQLGVEYAFHQKYSLSLAPMFKYSLNSINKTKSFNTKPYWLGLNFSIKYFIK